MSESGEIIRIGSRKSELALIQTRHVMDRLEKQFPSKSQDLITMNTMGDKVLDRPLPKIGEKSLFTKELETALAERSVDIVVHSLKDLPTTLPCGLAIGAILEREDPRDAVILNKKHRGLTLNTLPAKSVIGTSSLRRTAQLKRNFPHLEIKDIRGNLNTRLKKLDKGEYDGIVLAVAGIHRMNWDDRISEILDEESMLYAVGQGSLAVECRQADCHLYSCLSHKESALRAIAERSLLYTLEGGCSAPIAVASALTGSILSLRCGVWSLDGSSSLLKFAEINLEEFPSGDIPCPSRDLYCGLSNTGLNKVHVEAAYHLGQKLASEMVEIGALNLIKEAKLLNEISKK